MLLGRCNGFLMAYLLLNLPTLPILLDISLESFISLNKNLELFLFTGCALHSCVNLGMSTERELVSSPVSNFSVLSPLSLGDRATRQDVHLLPLLECE